MQLDDVPTARPRVEPVHVLGGQQEPGPPALQRRDRLMGPVGLERGDLLASPRVPLPHQPRVPLEGLGRGQVLGAEVPPKPLGPAEGGHPALGRDAGPGEDEHPLRAAQAGARRPQRLLQVGYPLRHPLNLIMSSLGRKVARSGGIMPDSWARPGPLPGFLSRWRRSLPSSWAAWPWSRPCGSRCPGGCGPCWWPRRPRCWLPALLILAVFRIPLRDGLGLRWPGPRTIALALGAGLAFWVASLGLFALQAAVWPLPPEYLEAFRRLHAALRPPAHWTPPGRWPPSPSRPPSARRSSSAARCCPPSTGRSGPRWPSPPARCCSR